MYAAQEFLQVFETLKNELVNDPLIAGQPDFAQKWLQRVRSFKPYHFCRSKLSDLLLYAQMLEFNVPGGKLNRGMAVLDVLKAIQGTEVWTYHIQSTKKRLENLLSMFAHVGHWHC